MTTSTGQHSSARAWAAPQAPKIWASKATTGRARVANNNKKNRQQAETTLTGRELHACAADADCRADKKLAPFGFARAVHSWSYDAAFK